MSEFAEQEVSTVNLKEKPAKNSIGAKIKTIAKKVMTPAFLHARNYDRFVDPEVYDEHITGQGREYLAHAVGDVLAEHLPPTDTENSRRVIDIAAGTGIVSRDFAARGWQITAIDLSKNALSYLQDNSSETVMPVQADMNNAFPFQDNVFDGATSVAANRFIKDPAAFLGEVHRILLPGGVLIWPLGLKDSIRWKLLSGLKTPTFPKSLAKLAEEKGFSEVSIATRDFPQSGKYPKLFPGTLRYIVAKK